MKRSLKHSKNTDIERYCHIADLQELKDNEFNLNVRGYIDISTIDGEIDVQGTISSFLLVDSKYELTKSINSRILSLFN